MKQYFPDCYFFEEYQVALWWAKKELDVTKQLRDYVGTNEKTTIILKISKKG